MTQRCKECDGEVVQECCPHCGDFIYVCTVCSRVYRIDEIYDDEPDYFLCRCCDHDKEAGSFSHYKDKYGLDPDEMGEQICNSCMNNCEHGLNCDGCTDRQGEIQY